MSPWPDVMANTRELDAPLADTTDCAWAEPTKPPPTPLRPKAGGRDVLTWAPKRSENVRAGARSRRARRFFFRRGPLPGGMPCASRRSPAAKAFACARGRGSPRAPPQMQVASWCVRRAFGTVAVAIVRLPRHASLTHVNGSSGRRRCSLIPPVPRGAHRRGTDHHRSDAARRGEGCRQSMRGCPLTPPPSPDPDPPRDVLRTRPAQWRKARTQCRSMRTTSLPSVAKWLGERLPNDRKDALPRRPAESVVALACL